MEEIITKKRYTPTKKRSQKVYNEKIVRLEKWYAERLKERANNPNKVPPYKPLKEIEWYLEKIKKPMGDK